MQGSDRERNVVLPLIDRAGALQATPTPHRLAKSRLRALQATPVPALPMIDQQGDRV
jgi:hypothetical protein